MEHDRVDVKCVNVLSAAGKDLAWRLQVDIVPLVLLYDLDGAERYRVSGIWVRPGTVARKVDDILRGAGSNPGSRC